MLNRNISKGLAMLALLFMLLPLLAQEAEVVETPAQALVRLSTTTVIPTVIVNKVAYAVGTEKGRPFQIRLEGGATQTFGIAKGRLAYRVDEDLYILDLQNGERRRALADYRVVNAAWNPSGTRVAAVVTRPEGLSLVISDLEEGPVTLVTSGTVLPDFVRWTSHGEVAYVVADTPDETKLLLLSDNGVVRSASIDRSSFPFLMGLTDAELTSDDLAVTLAASSNKEDAYPIAATDSAVWTASDGGLTIRARNNSIRSMIESAASTLTSGSGVQAAAAPATYGTYLGEYDSVQSYSNGNAGYVSNESNYINGTYIGMKWQCVEFVRRYYFSRFGLDLASKFTGDARDWWTGATAMNLDRFSNGGSTPPDPGDIIVSQGDGKNVGHVAIVRSRSANSVCTANQNLSNTAEQVNRCLTLNTSGSSYTLDGFGTAYPITGWLRRKSGGVSATAKAEITSPAPGNTLSSAVQTFAWTAGQGVSQYFFYAGTSAGNNNLYGNSTGTSQSVTVSNLPVNGSTIYIRLWSYIGSSWQFNDYQFRAATLVSQATAKAEITSPAPGSTLSSAVQTFAWTAGQGVSQYFFYAGTSAGNNDLYGNSTGTSRSVTVSNLPVNGSTIYIRLWSYIGSSWQFNDYQFRAATLVSQATAKAEITSPAPGSTLSSAVQTFAWTAGQGVSQYFFYAGTSAGNNNLYGNSTGTSRSVTVSNLPVNGSTIYIRLWSYIGSSWQFNDYQFRAAAR